MSRILVLGGAGFIGRSLAAQLVAKGHAVVIPTRRREWAKRNLIMLPTVELVPADIRDPATLTRLATGCDAVINLIGVLHRDFRAVHVELAKQLTAACIDAKVPRLIHMSALAAAADAPSEYLRTKAEGEQAVLGARDRLAVTVFRPSVVFGRDDALLNLFAGRISSADPADPFRAFMVWSQRFAPFMPLAGAQGKLQPVHVEDVARAIVASLDDDAACGKSYALAGPKVYTLEALVRYAQTLAGRPLPILKLGPRLGMLFAWIMELLPGRLLSRDNLRSLQVPSTTAEPFPFGIVPASLESVAPTYLSGVWPRTRFDRFRHRAGRHV